MTILVIGCASFIGSNFVGDGLFRLISENDASAESFKIFMSS